MNMVKPINILITLLLVTASLLPTSLMAETFEVAQENKSFTKLNLTINVGDSVKFVNNDPFFHNVFSLSDAALFDLGSYPKGSFKTISFEEAGTVEVECAIHPNMIMTIEVE